MEVSFLRAVEGLVHKLFVTVPNDPAVALGAEPDALARDAADAYASANNYKVSGEQSTIDNTDVDGIAPAPVDGGATHYAFDLTEEAPQAEVVNDGDVAASVTPVSTARVATKFE